MEDVLLTTRLFLFGVFLLAGIAKFADLAGSAKAIRDFGAPDAVAPALGVALPFAEIVFAACLLFPAYSWYGALGAGILLLTFVGGMFVQMAQGKAPDCHCFGQIHSEPVSRKSLVRNILLFAVALFLVLRGPAGQGAAISDGGRDPVILILLVAGTLLLVVAVSYLVRMSAHQVKMDDRIEMLEALSAGEIPKERQDAGDPLDGLPIGALFPEFTLGDGNAKPVSLDSLLAARRPVIFFFVGPTCLPCAALMPEIAEWNEELDGRVRFVLVTTGTPEDNAAKLAVPNNVTILFQKERELAEAVYAKWTPSAVFVRPDGRVASHLAAGDRAIRDLVSKIRQADLADPFVHVSNGNQARGRLRIGKSVSGVAVEDIRGRRITTADLVGKETLAVFWSRTCPHCVTMMDALRQWDLSKGPDEPNLLVFSEGDLSVHQQLGLKSPVILEDGYKTALELGMSGTPSAVLIDEDGRIVSEAAVGADNIWSLIVRKS